MANNSHCSDVNGDRALGARWEREFCKLAAQYGKTFTPHQIGREMSAAAHWYADGWHNLMLPDVTVWTSPGEHHEIKHKAPTDSGCFGLEDYRLRALIRFADETMQPVFYTIHNHNGQRDNTQSRGDDWITANVAMLVEAIDHRVAAGGRFNSYVGGEKRKVPGWFWPMHLWTPLLERWNQR